MYLQCKYIVSKINYYANFSPLGPENSLHTDTKKHRAELGPVRFYKLVFTKKY